MEGRLLEGSDVKMSCKSADGSDPIHYKWERVLDKGRYVGKLPPLALLGTIFQVPPLQHLLRTSRGTDIKYKK